MFRNKIVSFLSRLGAFLQTLGPVILKPRQLMDIEKLGYTSKKNIEAWSKNSVGVLLDSEKLIIDKYTKQKGKFLVLRSSGGREAQELAKLGFEVSGIEWVEDLIHFARKRAEGAGLNIKYIQGDVFELEKLEEKYDYVILGAGDYSGIISRKLRVEWLRRVKKLLNPNSKVFLNYNLDTVSYNKLDYYVKKLFAYLCLGNFHYQLGDRKITKNLYLHFFSGPEEIASEAEAACLKVLEKDIDTHLSRPWIIISN